MTFDYEIYTPGKEFDGPRRRGSDALSSSPLRDNPLSEKQFCSWLTSNIAYSTKTIHKIRFFRWNNKGMNFNFAACHTNPIYRYRCSLYDQREYICNETGWYPVVLGQWFDLYKNRPYIPQSNVLNTKLLENDIGKFISISNLDHNEQGSSIQVTTDNCSFLLDCGWALSNISSTPQKPRFLFISHSHKDHSGGMMKAIKLGIPVIISRTTMNYALFYPKEHRGISIVPGKSGEFIPIEPGIEIKALNGSYIKFIKGSHNPGSTMILINDGHDNEILYTGDYCANNAFLNDNPEALFSNFNSSKKKWLVLDATFLGHEPHTSSTNTISDLLNKYHQLVNEGRPVIFCARETDRLHSIYYLLNRHIYRTGIARDRERHMVIAKDIFRQLEGEYSKYVLKQKDSLDSILTNILADNYNTLGDFLGSVRLYPLNDYSIINDIPNPLDIIGNTDILHYLIRNKRISGWSIFYLGIGLTDKMSEEIISLGGNILHFDGPDFSFHSSSNDLINLIKTSNINDTHPILFHNYTKRIFKTLTKAGIDESCYSILSSKPLYFNNR
jgi:glyoxylase-like metal-dependent hydrolase (beta-lactamase superfamily II)